MLKRRALMIFLLLNLLCLSAAAYAEGGEVWRRYFAKPSLIDTPGGRLWVVGDVQYGNVFVCVLAWPQTVVTKIKEKVLVKYKLVDAAGWGGPTDGKVYQTKNLVSKPVLKYEWFAGPCGKIWARQDSVELHCGSTEDTFIHYTLPERQIIAGDVPVQGKIRIKHGTCIFYKE